MICGGSVARSFDLCVCVILLNPPEDCLYEAKQCEWTPVNKISELVSARY